MLTPVEILNRKTMLNDSIAKAVAEERMDDARRMEGQIMELDEMLASAIKAEEEMKAEALAKGSIVPPAVPRNRIERFLGARNAFKGLQIGDAVKVCMEGNIRNEEPSGAATTVVTIDDPTIEETTIPGWGESPFYGFADSLAHGTTTGDVKYMRRKTRGTNVGTWKSGETKAASYFGWEKKTAPLEVIASTVPVEEPTLKRYGELQNLFENELSIGLREGKDARSVSGNDSEGVTGILNTVGIQEYTAKTGDHVVDTIRRMVTLAIMNSRLYPTCVCVAPQVKEAMDLLKDDNGSYLTLMANGRVWNLPVIEDVNLVTTTTTGSEPTQKTYMHFGCIVYYQNAATLFSDGAQTLAVGTVNDQFNKNQITIRLEEAIALKVAYPDAFVYCQDAIAKEEVA